MSENIIPSSFEIKIQVSLKNPGKHIDEALGFAMEQRDKVRKKVYSFRQKSERSEVNKNALSDFLVTQEDLLEQWQATVEHLVNLKIENR